MSRLKFRAWHEESKAMVDFILTDITADINGYCGLYIAINGVYEFKLLTSLKIMQYLGEDCIDEDNNEICEGDIVELWFDDGIGTKIICTVIYELGEFSFKHNKSLWSIPSKMEDSKIIGNIHQNQELWK